MSKHVIVFGASNSIHSINKKFATYAAEQIADAEIEILDLNDYEMPIYSIDRENESGIPDLASQFKAKIKSSDGIIISFAEHNGAYTVAFKNVMDWMSRLEGKVWEDKPMLLLSTSPGGRGGKGVLGIAVNGFPHMGARSIVSFSLPSFQKNFEVGNGIGDEALKNDFEEQVEEFETKL